MSLVVFPFKQEDPAVIRANLEAAALHRRVEEVWGVAAQGGASLEEAADGAREVATRTGTPVLVFAQERIGDYRSGKGDGMNTAISRAAEREFDRIHFYDADITNFDERWIDGAEQAADNGYEVVRHRFPRASTDAMITWMVTRPALAFLFPRTVLPRIGQPLGGELAITGAVARTLATDPLVRARSDWGIDTILTYATATLGIPLYEHNLAEGKRHALYGSLAEIRTMVIECLDAVKSLAGRPAPQRETEFVADPPAPVPEDLKRTIGYDVEPTMRLLATGWSDAEVELAHGLPGGIGEELVRNLDAPHFEFMDTGAWGGTLPFLLEHFELGNPDWESLAFRLWLTRVLAYTTGPALAGYDSAIDYLEDSILAYEKGAEDTGSFGAHRP